VDIVESILSTMVDDPRLGVALTGRGDLKKNEMLSLLVVK
jgi:hypothetical protein